MTTAPFQPAPLQETEKGESKARNHGRRREGIYLLWQEHRVRLRYVPARSFVPYLAARTPFLFPDFCFLSSSTMTFSSSSRYIPTWGVLPLRTLDDPRFFPQVFNCPNLTSSPLTIHFTLGSLVWSLTTNPDSQASHLLLWQAIGPPLHLQQGQGREHARGAALLVPRPSGRAVHLRPRQHREPEAIGQRLRLRRAAGW